MAERVVRILQKGEKLIAVRKSTSLKQGLKDYYEETLKPRGFTDPIYSGNTLTVRDGSLEDRTYVAREAK